MGRIGWIPHSSSCYPAAPSALAGPPPVPPVAGGAECLSSHGAAALAAGGGLSALTWLGRRSRQSHGGVGFQRCTNTATAAAAATTALGVRWPWRRRLSTAQEEDVGGRVAAGGRRRRNAVSLQRSGLHNQHHQQRQQGLQVHFLYSTPILKPGSSSERLPALNWQEEAEEVRSALGLCTEACLEDDGNSSSSSSSLTHVSQCGGIQLQMTVATVETLSRLAASSSSARARHTWWHIAAHSEPGTGRLILEDEDGGAQPISMSAMAFRCRSPQPPLGALVLACAGEQAGQELLTSGVGFAVVACGSLGDATAKVFARHFYQRLRSVHGAPSLSQESAAEQVRFAFNAAREILKNSTKQALRREADHLRLLERRDSSISVPLTLPASFRPVAMAPKSSEQEDSTGVPDALHAADAAAGISLLHDSRAAAADKPEQAALFGEDCEDFLGRGDILHRLLQLLGQPGGRRVFVLYGLAGSGKSALAAELCRFAIAPGRKFSQVGDSRRLAYVSLEEPLIDSDLDTASACIRLETLAAADSLSSAGRTCLIIDHAEREFGWSDDLVQEILDRHPQLRLLLMRRSPLYRIESIGGDRWKPINLALGPLQHEEAAQLFLQRLHRPLYHSDFERLGDQGGSAKPKGCPLRCDPALLRSLRYLPAFEACGGQPRQLARLAAQVTWDLPSLLDLKVEEAST